MAVERAVEQSHLQPLQIQDELVLLLDDALVVHLVEVALLAELVPRPLRRRRDLLHLLDLGAHVLELVVELLVAQVDVGHRPHVAGGQLALRLHPVPLALEHVERLAHLHLEQHVADEVVEHLGPPRHLAARRLDARPRRARTVGLRLDRRHHLLQILVVLPLLLLLVHLHLRVLVLVVVVVERHLLEVVRVVGVGRRRGRAGRRVEVERRGHRGSCAASLRGAAKIARAARASPAPRSALEERSEAGVERPTATLLERAGPQTRGASGEIFLFRA